MVLKLEPCCTEPDNEFKREPWLAIGACDVKKEGALPFEHALDLARHLYEPSDIIFLSPGIVV